MSNENDGNTPTTLSKANFNNCIIHTSSNFGIILEKTNQNFNYKFDHSLIKFADFSNQFINNELYDFSNINLFDTCLIARSSTNNNPDFKDARNNKLIIGENSAAKGTADNTYSTFYDILNNQRNVATDMGAYNWTTFD